MKKIIGINFLNPRLSIQGRLGVPDTYVVIDKVEWSAVVKFFREHPELLNEIDKPILTDQEKYIMEEIIKGIIAKLNEGSDPKIVALKGVKVNKANLTCHAVSDENGITLWGDGDTVYVESHVLHLMFEIIC